MTKKQQNTSKFSRILFKVSGEAMMGSKGFGHDIEAISKICKQITSLLFCGILYFG